MSLRREIQSTKLLSVDEIKILIHRYKNLITKDGYLKLESQKFRSQPRNKQDLQEKLCKILASIFVQHKQRVLRKKVPKKEKEKRLDDKKRRKVVKKLRRKIQ